MLAAFREQLDSVGVDFFARLDEGVCGDFGGWRRISVTDRRGRVGGLLAEIRGNVEPLAWYSRFHQADALFALTQLEIPDGARHRLEAWIRSTAYVERVGSRALWTPIPVVGPHPLFFRGQAVWHQWTGSLDFWRSMAAAFMAHVESGDPLIPFASRTARDAWAAKCLEDSPGAASSAAVDFVACRDAVLSRPYLA